MIEEINISCPYCGEQFTSVVDYSAGSQQYTEDCYVCCRPIVFHIEVDSSGELDSIRTQREDD